MNKTTFDMNKLTLKSFLLILVLSSSFGALQELCRSWLGVSENLWGALMFLPVVCYITYLFIKKRRNRLIHQKAQEPQRRERLNESL